MNYLTRNRRWIRNFSIKLRKTSTNILRLSTKWLSWIVRIKIKWSSCWKEWDWIFCDEMGSVEYDNFFTSVMRFQVGWEIQLERIGYCVENRNYTVDKKMNSHAIVNLIWLHNIKFFAHLLLALILFQTSFLRYYWIHRSIFS